MMMTNFHDVIKGLRERQLSFYHTELGQMMSRMGIFSTERRTKSVHLWQGTTTIHLKTTCRVTHRELTVY